MLGECDAVTAFASWTIGLESGFATQTPATSLFLLQNSLSGRFQTVIETLAQHLPLIAVELKTYQLDTDPPVATILPIVFAQPDDIILKPADEPEKSEGLVPNIEATQ